MCHRLSLLVGAALTLAQPATSQAPLPAGSRVRVTAPEMLLDRQRGRLVMLSADSLALESSGSDLGASHAASVRWVVPRELLVHLETSQGRRGHATKGMLIGAAVGLTAGLLATDFGRSPSTCRGSGDYRLLCGLVIGGYTVGGSALGLIVGSTIRTERWAPVSLPRTR